MKFLPTLAVVLLLFRATVGQPVPNRRVSLESISILNNRAIEQVENGNPADALRLLNLALTQQPNDTISFNRAMVLARLGRTADAITALKSVNYLPTGLLNQGIWRCRLGQWDAGRADMQAASTANGWAEERAFNLAVANWHLGRFAEASRALNEAGPPVRRHDSVGSPVRRHDSVGTSVADPSAIQLLAADLLFLQNKPDEAIGRYNTLSRLSRSAAGATLRLAQGRLQAKLYDEATDLFREVLVSDDKRPATQFSAQYGLGVGFYARHQTERAITAFQSALRVDASSVLAQAGLAHALCSSHKYKDALTAYERLLTLNPADKTAQLGMAVALTRLDRPRDALKAFKAAETLMNPTDSLLADAFLHRGLALLVLNLPVQAVAAFETASNLRPNQPLLLAAVSEANRRAGRLIPAIQTLSDALRKDPQNMAMLANRGTMLLQFDRIEDAYIDFLNVLKIKPKHVNALNGIGIALLEVDKIDEARFTFDGLVGAGNDKPYLHNNRGIVESYAGLRAEKTGQSKQAALAFALARDEFDRAQRLDTSGVSYQNNLGNALRNLNLPDEAIRAYQKFLNRSARNNLGILLAAQKRPAEARRYFESAVQADTSDRLFRYNRLHFYQTNFSDSIIHRPDLQRNNRRSDWAGISAKYSRDGYMTGYLYDFGFDPYPYPANHWFPVTPELLRPPDLQSAETFLTMLELPYVEALSMPVQVKITPPPPAPAAPIAPSPTAVLVAIAKPTAPKKPVAAAQTAPVLAAAITAPTPAVTIRRTLTPGDTPSPKEKSVVQKRQKMPAFPRASRRKWGRMDCFF